MNIQCRIPNAGLKKVPLHYELWLAVLQWANPGICGIQALNNICTMQNS